MAILSDEQRAFLGMGWAYPVNLPAGGTLGRAAYEEDVRQAILIILGTNPGERVMRPDFGAGLNTFIFEPLSTTTLVLVENRVREALIDWEPRIEVLAVDVTYRQAEPGRLAIEIHYRVRATNALGNLVYPFYLREGASA